MDACSAEELAASYGFAAALRAGQDLRPLAAPRFLDMLARHRGYVTTHFRGWRWPTA